MSLQFGGLDSQTDRIHQSVQAINLVNEITFIVYMEPTSLDLDLFRLDFDLEISGITCEGD